MANLDFISDLKLGNDGEESIIKHLLSNGCIYVDSNNDNKYDLKMITKGVETTYEIKTDVKCAPLFDTGNLFIEFESRGKASGIVVTEADWFVTYFKYLNQAWFIKSDKLKQLINENDFPTFKDAGDIGSATHGYLIKRKDFKEHFYVCKI
jgi:hypothetical protein